MEEEIEGLYDAIVRDLRAGVAVDFQALSTSTGYSLVRKAAKSDQVEIMRMLLDGGCPVNTSETDHDSPLHLALGINRYDMRWMVDLLLEKGADLNKRNEHGNTPFLIAVEKSDSHMVDLLIKYGADINVDLFNAIREGNLQETTRLIDSCEESASSGLLGGYSPLRLAVYMKYVDIVKLLLDRGYPLNASVTVYDSLLHLAVRNRSCEIVELLLKKGADVNETNYGGTALHWAVYYENEEIVELLLANGAIANCVNVRGNSPLHNLAGFKTPKFREMGTLLLKWGADVNCKTEIGRTALHIAAEEGNGGFVKFLLENGAQVNCKDKEGEFPLYLAHDHKIIGILMEFGASVDCRDTEGRTPLHFNSAYSCSMEVATLLEYGADINIKCKRDMTPLDANSFSYDDYCCDRETDSINRTRNILLRHQAKMEAVGLHVEESDFLDSDEEMLEGFRNSCQEEVLLLKSTLISGTSVSYYDLLRRDVRFLARYMNNENVVQAAESEEYRSKFPTYASVIKSQFRRGKARNKLLKSASQVLNQLIDLPDYCSEKIMDYLSDDDLAVLIDFRDLVTD